MTWIDYGTIFHTDRQEAWINSHAYIPTALLLDNKIRVYVAFWDKDKMGRVGYIDVNASNPREVIAYSQNPVLNIGQPKDFDEHGVTPMSIQFDGENYRLYYVGWQRQADEKIRYKLFVGLALSKDALHFERVDRKPIIGPTQDNPFMRSGCFITYLDNAWRCWYAEYQDALFIDGKGIPQYDLYYMQSPDGLTWPQKGQLIFASNKEQTFGYGRSAIWKENQHLHALFLKRAVKEGYHIFEHATSKNGFDWLYQNEINYTFNLKNTCDQQNNISFPNIIEVKDQKYMFYNGDDFGKAGLRLAVWKERT